MLLSFLRLVNLHQLALIRINYHHHQLETFGNFWQLLSPCHHVIMSSFPHVIVIFATCQFASICISINQCIHWKCADSIINEIKICILANALSLYILFSGVGFLCALISCCRSCIFTVVALTWFLAVHNSSIGDLITQSLTD